MELIVVVCATKVNGQDQYVDAVDVNGQGSEFVGERICLGVWVPFLQVSYERTSSSVAESTTTFAR